MTWEVKQCATCGKWYQAGAFSVDNTHPSKLQPQCKRCRAEWELSPENKYKRMYADFHNPKSRSYEPEVFLEPNGWTLQRYLDLWGTQRGECCSCGCSLSAWQLSGHHLDRVHNAGGHWPDNCRLVCWPCNEFKSNKLSTVSALEIRGLIDHYAPALIQWDEARPGKHRRAVLPDISHLEVPEPPRFPLFPGWEPA